MRADKLMMLGVGTLGLYAVYRMFRAESSTGPEGVSEKEVSPSPSLLLEAGGQYGLRLELGELPPFSQDAGDDQIARAMKELGFSSVQVFRVPPPFAHAAVSQGMTPNTRFVLAQWGRGTMNVTKPRALTFVWLIMRGTVSV